MSGITTRVLDTSVGRPAGGITVRLLRGDVAVTAATTDGDGRWVALAGHATTCVKSPLRAPLDSHPPGW